MNAVLAIFKKELASYMASPVGYVFIIFYTLVANACFFIFLNDFFQAGQITMRAYFMVMPWIFLFFVPAITMRLWSEEKKIGTVETLLTMPLTEFQIILGKFFASLAFICITLLCSLTIPISLSIMGSMDWGVVLGSYIGAVLMGAAYLSIGLYFSSLTDNQVVAFIISLSVIFVLLLLGLVPQHLPWLGVFVEVCDYLSLYSHFRNIVRGVIDSRDVVYYLSVIALFLYLNKNNIQARKWR